MALTENPLDFYHGKAKLLNILWAHEERGALEAKAS